MDSRPLCRSGVAVTATVAFGVLELEAEMSTETDRQLLTDGVSFDVVMSAGGDRGFESWRKLHRRYPCIEGTSTKFF